MKTSMIGLGCFAMILASCSNQHIPSSDVPSVVQNTVRAKYPDVKEIEWKNLGNAYEAEVDVNDSTEVVLQVNREGKALLQKQDISLTVLPAAVLTAVQSSYADYTIEDAEQVEKEGSVYYQLELDGKGKKDLQLVFAADGKEDKTTGYWD